MGWIKSNQKCICLFLGLVGMIVTIIPNLILGEHAIFNYHDQLDGEVIAYILQAKHLFDGGQLPEFMGGMPKTALVMPAPIFVLLFLGGEYMWALTIMLLIGRVVGFVGMYLLAKECTDNPWVSLVVGGMYGILPFQPVYGLSQFGIPLLFWCVLQIRQGKHMVLSYLYIVLYGLGSSLVLVGFAILGAGCVWIVTEFAMHKKSEKGTQRLVCSCVSVALLLVMYLLANIGLLEQIFGGGEAVVSHKTEYVLGVQAFWPTFAEYMLHGIQHSQSFHHILLPVSTLFAILLLFVAAGKHGGDLGNRLKALLTEDVQLGRILKVVAMCLGCNVALGLLAAFWNSESLVNIRNNMGALKAFHFERVLWMTPCIWYLLEACLIVIVWKCLKKITGKMGRVVAVLSWGGLAVTVALTGLQIFMAGDMKSNVQKLRNPDYGILSFYEYYAIDVMDQVEAFIQQTTGLEQEEYRVVSLGIDPAAALYHGFYSVDGYSNNYDVEYKHAFREVLTPELAKSEYLQNYYDAWGNRCYLFSAECPGYYTIEKDGFYFQEYEINTKALKKLGCDFILSAAYILNGEQQGLKLMNEVPFEAEDSYYRIYVYEVSD